MTKFEYTGQNLTIHTDTETIDVDLCSAVRARMYNRVLVRDYVADEFVVGDIMQLHRGVKVFLTNEKEGLIIPVVFRSAENGFRVVLPAGEITEQCEINRKLMAVDLLPELMSSTVDDDGFFLLPCLSGVLVRFDQKQPCINRDRLYMHQSEWEKVNLMNCFAVNKSGKGILAVVDQGDFFCHVTTELNQQGKNRIYPSFGLRHKDSERVKHETKEVIYTFLQEGESEYPDMAKVYRDYLVHERDVVPLKDRVPTNPTLAYSVEAMRVKIFMGLKKPCTSDGLSPMTVYTTFQQAEEILDTMKESGIDKAVITLVGWNLGGHDGAYPSRFPVEPELGGEKGLRRLIEKALAMGYQIVPHDNVTDVYRSAADFDPEFLTRDEDQQPRVVGIWGGGQSFKACPVAYLERYGYVFNKIQELGFSGHYYLDAQASVLWRCHDPSHPADEREYALSLARMAQIARVKYGAVSTEMAPAYNLPYIDEAGTIHSVNNAEFCFHRLQGTNDSFLAIIDRVVPFYQIAVHGLITYQESWVHKYRKNPGGTKIGLLKALACGARPCMEVSFENGANGDYYLDSIRDVEDAYRTAFEELGDIHIETIEKYEELSDDVRRITYSNGQILTVNWGTQEFEGVPAAGYTVA